MAKVYVEKNSFNAGEISGLVSFRDDIQKYSSACLTLENATPLVEGGAKKMPGTYFAGASALGGAMFTGSIAGNVLTVTAVNYGVLQLGQTLAGATILPGTILTGGGGTGTVYNPSTTSGTASVAATPTRTHVQQIVPLSAFPSVACTTATLSVYVSGSVITFPGGSGQLQLQYSVNGGTSWINSQSWTADVTATVSISLTGLTNLNTVQIRIIASASYAGGGNPPTLAFLSVDNWFATVTGSGGSGSGTGTGGVGTYTISQSQTVGSELMQTVSNGKSRLVPFQFSTLQGAILEFSAGIVRIWEGASQGQWSLGLALQTPAAGENYNPQTAYIAGQLALVGPYAPALFYTGSTPNPSLGVLTIAAPYGVSIATPVPITFTTNGSDALAVTITGSSPNQGLNIALANSTPSNNSATAIMAQIQALASLNSSTSNFVDLTAWTVTPDPIYFATPWITAPTMPSSLSVGGTASFIAQAVTPNTANEFPVTYNGNFNSIYWVAYNATAQPPIELTTPYLEGDLFTLDCSTQSADVLWVFHPSYPPAVIERLGANSWSYSLSLPGQQPGEPPYRGTLGVVKTGYSALGQSIVAIDPTPINYIGLATGAETPAPFTNGDRIYINECAGLEQLNEGEFIVSGIQIAAGEPFNWQFQLLDPESLAVVQISAALPYAGGGFAVKVVPLFAATGDYPACGTLFQERLAVGGSNNNPTQMNASVADDYPDFICDPNEDDYALQFTLVSNQVNELLNMISTPNALLIGTSGGVWVMQGSGGGSLTQTNVSAAIQTTQGVAALQPQLVNGSAIFVSRSARIVTFMVYNFTTNQWESNDLTRLNRSITLGPTQAQSGIAQTAFQVEPYPIFWAARNDGQLIGLVFNTQDQVYAWFRVNMTAEGEFIESCAVISGSGQEDQLVVVVRRTINGVVQRFVEYFMPQELFGQLSNAFFVHCGQQLDGGASVPITGISNANPPVAQAANHGFSNGQTVQILGVTGMVSPTGQSINQEPTQAYTVEGATTNTFELAGMDTTTWSAYVSGGSVEQVFNEVTGMSYLLGNEVTAVGDGAVILPPTLVTSDTVTFPYYANLITIGLPYTMTVQPTNPVLSSQGATTRGMPQKLNRYTLSLYESMGGQVGEDLAHMYDITYGQGAKLQPPQMSTFEVTRDMDCDWSEESTLLVTQSDPLPFTLRGIVFRMSANTD